ncbi:hypothetical protein HHK36_014002 [Tetracentron sinense]|uniref:Expansin-like EG45 domain-containing protein n=1 Tax=Tetracentron sinense TaxID=13715 RepID=A0A834ZEB6_TETSI|nr:hypothetical protein HHK36_014002 [Tetracentron sinense]
MVQRGDGASKTKNRIELPESMSTVASENLLDAPCHELHLTLFNHRRQLHSLFMTIRVLSSTSQMATILTTVPLSSGSFGDANDSFERAAYLTIPSSRIGMENEVDVMRPALVRPLFEHHDTGFTSWRREDSGAVISVPASNIKNNQAREGPSLLRCISSGRLSTTLPPLSFIVLFLLWDGSVSFEALKFCAFGLPPQGLLNLILQDLIFSRPEAGKMSRPLKLLQRLLLSFFFAELFYFSHGDVGTAGHYDSPYFPTACYGNDGTQFPSDNMFASISEGLWDNGASCGRLYLVRCISARDPGTCLTGQSIQVVILDRASTSVSRPSRDTATIVLSKFAFAAIANVSANWINMEFLQV